jgi:hypothetical protein
MHGANGENEQQRIFPRSVSWLHHTWSTAMRSQIVAAGLVDARGSMRAWRFEKLSILRLPSKSENRTLVLGTDG